MLSQCARLFQNSAPCSSLLVYLILLPSQERDGAGILFFPFYCYLYLSFLHSLFKALFSGFYIFYGFSY